MPPSNTDLLFTVTRDGTTTTNTPSATPKTITLVGTTTKVTIGLLTASDGTQNAFVKIANAQLISNVVLRADAVGEWAGGGHGGGEGGARRAEGWPGAGGARGAGPLRPSHPESCRGCCRSSPPPVTLPHPTRDSVAAAR